MKFLPYSRQSIDTKDIEAVVGVLRSDYLTTGPQIEKFERAICRYTGAKYAIVCSSGTAALHLACLAAHVKKGSEGITSPLSFAASANCMLYTNLRPVFADITPKTFTIDPRAIQKKITKKTKLIIPVHFAGHSCDLKSISKIAKKKSLTVIEDASHAFGARYNGSRIGDCRYSDMATFSFHPVKSLTSGEGGAVTTNNRHYYEQMKALLNHGIVRNKFLNQTSAFENGAANPWYYEMQNLGFNYRLTDMQAALGLSQLRKINSFILKRRKIAQMYTKAFRNVPWINLPQEQKNCYSPYHLYTLQIDFKALGISRREVMEKLRRRGVGSQVHYIPIYRQPFYQKMKVGNWRDFPETEKFYSRCLSIPIYPDMTQKDIIRVVGAVKGLD